MKNFYLSSVLAGFLLLAVSGCADNTARDAAAQAQITADQAAQCCEYNNEKIDRVYQKIMTK